MKVKLKLSLELVKLSYSLFGRNQSFEMLKISYLCWVNHYTHNMKAFQKLLRDLAGRESWRSENRLGFRIEIYWMVICR